MSVIAVAAHRPKAQGFVALLLRKASGQVWAYIPSDYPTSWRAKRKLKRRIQEWSKDQSFDQLFVDTRRRDGTTYWRRIR